MFRFEKLINPENMKLAIFLLPLLFFLQTGGCGDDDSVDDGGSINENFIEFLGTRNVASGGCNQGNPTSSNPTCAYGGGYSLDGLCYAIALSHTGFCRTASFNLRDNINQASNAFFIIQIAENGVATETFLGSTGWVDVFDSGTVTGFEFSGTVISTLTGEEETISGYMECPL